MSAVIAIDPGMVEQHIMELAQFGACAETGVCRTVYSAEWVAAQDHITSWCREAGLSVRQDAVGSVWARLEGSEPGPSIVTGSHIDSQVPGGRYDGVLGVIAGVIALAHAQGTLRSPPADSGGHLVLRGRGESLPGDELVGLSSDHRRHWAK